MANELEGTKLALINAAGKLFADKGFEGTSVRAIAEEAGANIAAVNYHFGSKENLYTEALRYVVDKRSDGTCLRQGEIQGCFDTPSAAAQSIYSTVMERFTSYFSKARPPWHSQLLMQSILKPSEALRTIVEQAFRPDHEELIAMFRKADPTLSDEQAQLWAFSFSAHITFYVLAKTPILMLLDREEYDGPFIEAAADHAAHTIIAALGLPRPEGHLNVAAPVGALTTDEEDADES